MRENIEYLQRLGLTEYQSKAIVVMFSKQEITAKEISDSAGIPQTKIYQVLKSLEDKELIEVSPGKPRIYRSLEPRTLMAFLLEKKQKGIDMLKTAKRAQLKLLREVEEGIIFETTITSEKVHPCLAASQYSMKY